ncbi:hypothetical protein EQV97_22865 [Pseudomonas sp. TMW22090]|uniref:hypothetical protein n=1 Tax=Pseudomonas sp. TMW22090 TaxID=2506434 RepID=UPI001F0D1ECF|nr:hypothetical protein [Pseudomonas sp. TMW22090]MCH4880202.1 hypothetical protein [Pseudomonas sp. TMW22090]
MSPHILIDQDLDELNHPGCPEGYEVLVMRNITAFLQAQKISIEEFHHYCERLNRAVASRPRSCNEHCTG